jgi:hypothetical protein
MFMKESRGAGRASRRRPLLARRPRRDVRGQGAGYWDPFFADPAAVEDDSRRLRGPDD